MGEKCVTIYNKGSRRFKVVNDPVKGNHVWLEPGTSLEVESEKAAKLLQLYSRELVDLSKMAKPSKGTADLEKAVNDRDARISELLAKIEALEAKLASIGSEEKPRKEKKDK